MLVRSGAARHTYPMRQLLTSRPLRLASRACVCTPSAPLAESRRVLTTVTDSRPRKKKTFRALVGFERNLATALEEHRFGDDVPFEGFAGGLSSSSRQPDRSSPPLYMLQPYDVQSPLVVKAPKPYPQRTRMNHWGIPGDVEEMLSVFDACVQIGRLERAALVLKRFDSMKALDAHKMMELNNRYLQSRVAQLAPEPNQETADAVHRWFEVNIRGRDLPITPVTIAYMLKISLLCLQGDLLRKRIDRYMSLMPQQNAMEPLDLGNVLTDEDLATIAEVCPSYYVPEPEGPSDALNAEAPRDPDGGLERPDEPAGTSDSTRTGVPEVLSTQQKGMGLQALKATLSFFSELPDGLDLSALSESQRLEVQAKLERDSIDAAIAKWRSENDTLQGLGLTTQLGSQSFNSRLGDWHKALEARLAAELAKVAASEAVAKKTSEDLDRCVWGPLLLQAPPSRLAAVTILSVLSLFAMHGADRGIPVSTMVQQVANIAEEDMRMQRVTNQLPGSKSKSPKLKNARQLMRHARSRDADQTLTPIITTGAGTEPAAKADDSVDLAWPTSIRSKIGAVLLSALLDSTKVVVKREHPETKKLVMQTQPAFTHTVQLKKGHKIGVITPNRTLVELMKREPRGEALARHLPMLVEPVPWSKFDKGGFVTCHSPLLRLKNNEKDQRFYAEAAIERGDMEQMMRGLDVLGKTAWRINRPVFDVMLEAWNTGDEFANFPPVDPELPTPPEPDSTDDPMKKRLWLRAVKAIENEKSGYHSVRCYINFQLEIARAFRDQTFYFPHNLDFRGRAYPMPTYLNHMGADHMRGLLIFAEGKPLGEQGLRWLKVHLANVYGFDKASLQGREDFATQNLENIFDSADNPLTGRRWWLEGEDPWQTLATCFELKAAMSSPDPAAYVSHFPVHQDGTCNGLQHYAALGGDVWGAQQVNLLPGDKPADVYMAVAELVQKQVEEDLAAGNKFAAAANGKIKRKVVKQTVMTNVYGVTFVGAKKQVAKQLEALYPDLEEETGFSPAVLGSYIASKVFMGLSTMFRGAHDIQSWLGEIGGRVCRAVSAEQLNRLAEEVSEKEAGEKKKKPKAKASKVGKARKAPSVEDEVAAQFRNTLVWTTPLRMPVVQPYRKSGTRLISTCLQDLVLTSAERDDPVNRRKQLQAFPPNFIHSLDASHMMLSALECSEIGLSFAAVHDSFWTHAADVDAMNKVIRDSFIRIHQEDVIGRLKAEFEARYRGSLYRARLDSKTEIAKVIMQHRRKHRVGIKEELMQEHRRQELLRSDDPEEVQQGREMVTPASLFEMMAEPGAVANVVDPEELVAADEEDADELDGGESAADVVDDAGEFAMEMDNDREPLDGDRDPMDDAPADALVQPLPSAGSQDHSHLSKYGDQLAKLHGSNFFVAEMDKANRRAQRGIKYTSFVSLWLPLTFPDIPKKGGFDVSQLKESKYFFS